MRHPNGLVSLLSLVFMSLVASPTTTSGHDHSHPTPDEIRLAREDGTYDVRMSRLLRSDPHRMSDGLAERAAYKMRRASMEAMGMAPREIADRLFSGPQFAFPFTSPRELRPFGTVETLTVLIDFQDFRAATLLPGMNAQRFSDNIYGSGTAEAQNHRPYESLNAYYRRASQNRVNIQGNVLGWHHFQNSRSTYEPAQAPPGPLQENQQLVFDNQAIFELAVDVLQAHDSTHDFSRYDNDNDGDIDLLTILYAGPDNGWGGFWWAYRWEFFVQGASTQRFDGKRLRQFVFQFVNTRGPNNDDFHPLTLMHEMGHAFGLADYYDYNASVGPQGGVGGLDMMHGNWGNHNAFSRWLLDWIEPRVIGAGAPASTCLVASGSEIDRDKAIAVFPGLSNTNAPSQEMFLIENRSQFGNDAGVAGTPGSGVLVWHVDASVNSSGNNFQFDNSFTPHKLIRLVRANTASDFLHGENASAATYFRTGSSFTPTSISPSDGLNGPTNVSADQISVAGETMALRVGILQPSPSPAAVQMAGFVDDPQAAFDAVAERLVNEVTNPGPSSIDLDRLEQLDQALTTATPQQLAELWRQLAPAEMPTETCQLSLTLQVLLTHWASKSGATAVKVIQDLPDCAFRSKTYSMAMETWANADSSAAFSWYFDDAQNELRQSNSLAAGPDFAETTFRCCARLEPKEAIEFIDKLTHPSEIWGAVRGLRDASQRAGHSEDDLQRQLRALKARKQIAESIRMIQETMERADANLSDLETKQQFKNLVRESLGSD